MRTTLFRKIILASMTGIFFAGYAALSLAGTQAAKQEAMASQIAVQTENTLVGNIKSDGLRQAEIPEIIRLAQMDNAGTISDLASITKLSVLQDGEETVVEIHGSEDLEYTAFKLLNPLRLVMDFPGVSRGKFNEKIEVNSDLVNHINPLYFSEAQVLRVEIVLNHTASYDIQKISQNQLEVRFKPVSVQAEASMDQTQTAKAADPSQPESAPMDFTFMGGQMVDSCAHLLSGEKDRISLDFQNVEVIDILRIIADISGYNIVLSKGSFGLTNIKLKDVPWNQVLEIILRNNNLGRECDGNIIRIASQAALAASQEEGLLVTEIVRVNYANLDALATGLRKMMSERGTINKNRHINSLIINDIQEKV
ncbi:MAG: AMIN domain-containing protein, partial [Nitrospinae bacterium]|nr:AMIN domain-containing protein [Nitrospinota bacterium]